MATTLKLRFTTNGQSSYKGKLSLEISKKDTTTRAYILVKNLKSSNLNNWDKNNQQFIGKDAITASNNSVLQSLLTSVEFLLNNTELQFDTPQQLKEAYEKGINIQAKRFPTMGEYVKIIVDEGKNANESTNYQVYLALYNKLNAPNPPMFEGKRIADIPINEITDEHFKAFFYWLTDLPKIVGYRNLMTNFKSTLSHASNRRNIPTHPLFFKFRDFIPKRRPNNQNLTAKQKIQIAENSIVVLEPEELEKFKNFDLTQIEPKQTELKKIFTHLF